MRLWTRRNSMSELSLRVFDDAATLSGAAADELELTASESISRRGVCSFVLAGGNTPRELYRRLASPSYRDLIDWAHIEIFWGDERCVPPDHPASNYSMAQEALVSHVPIPRAQVHRIRGELEPNRAAALYDQEIRAVTGSGQPRFDVVLLGVGVDGHTASLFPDTPNLVDEKRLVVATVSPRPPRSRVTLTLRTINSARKAMFLVAGSEKAAIVAALANDAATSATLPAALVRPQGGQLLWMLDREAAAQLAG